MVWERRAGGGGERQKFTFGVWEQAEPEIVSDSLGLHAARPGAPRRGKMAPSPSCHSSAHSRPGLIKFWSIPLRSGSIPNERLKMGLSAALENKMFAFPKLFFFLLESKFYDAEWVILWLPRRMFFCFFLFCVTDPHYAYTEQSATRALTLKEDTWLETLLPPLIMPSQIDYIKVPLSHHFSHFVSVKELICPPPSSHVCMTVQKAIKNTCCQEAGGSKCLCNYSHRGEEKKKTN